MESSRTATPSPLAVVLRCVRPDLDEPDPVPTQFGQDDLLDVAQGLIELVAGVRREHYEVLEGEVTASGVCEPAQQDRSGIDTHAVTHHNR